MRLKNLLLGGLMLIATTFVPLARAQPTAVLWTNTSIVFTQSNGDSDFLTSQASIDRGGNEVLFNSSTSPTPDTVLWAEGTIQNYLALSYQPMGNYRNGDLAGVLESHSWVMWLTNVNESIYIPVTFSAWGQHGAGGWTYTRGTAPVPPPPPSVSITTPTNNSVFTVPATFSVTASATVSNGTVTNVTFFANATSLGSVTNAPFTVTASSLPVGSYALKAVATAAGISATSTVVNVSVNPPIGTLLLSSVAVTNGVFSFNYNTASGSNYVVQKSSTFSAWQPVVTNIGSGGLIHFTDAVSGGGNFYRVDQVSGP